LTPVVVFWRFKNPSKLQFSKWEFTWDFEGSFPHTLLHSLEHEMWLLGFFLARTLASPCLSRELKVRVATQITLPSMFIKHQWHNKLESSNHFALNHTQSAYFSIHFLHIPSERSPSPKFFLMNLFILPQLFYPPSPHTTHKAHIDH